MITALRRELLDPLVDLVLPRSCAGCGAPGQLLCRRCGDPGRAGPVGCGGLAATAAGPYEDGLRRAVLAYKERGRRDLAGPLGTLLAAAIATAVGGVAPSARVLVVPVPTTRRAAARRGGDHVARLARIASRETGLRSVRWVPGVLSLGRAVADSAGLGLDARAENLAGAMRARAPAPCDVRPRVVVVDDVITSGATLREAARALTAAGWRVVAVAAVAATPRRHEKPPRRRPDPLAGVVGRSSVRST